MGKKVVFTEIVKLGLASGRHGTTGVAVSINHSDSWCAHCNKGVEVKACDHVLEGLD